MKDIIYKIVFYLFSFFPKKKKALIIDSIKLDDNALEMANYLAENCGIEVNIMLPKSQIKSLDDIKEFIHPSIRFFEMFTFKTFSWKSFEVFFSSKYIYFSHSFYYGNFIQKQILVNIWHGVALKKIHKARNESNGVRADYTIATSEVVRENCAATFNVPLDTVLSAGLPRNDLMLRSKSSKSIIKENFPKEVKNYSKFIIWMPTYRRQNNDAAKMIKEVDNIFGIQDFNLERFNEILEQNNTVCFVKTHYFITAKNETEFSNIHLIDDNWLLKHHLLLYQFIGCTDALISDYSSIIVDYILLDKPIFSIAEDLEEYKKTQGLYYEDYENWVPGDLFRNSNDFLNAFEKFLVTENDESKEKRHKMRDIYFQFQDENSAKRIAALTLK